jgi:uncharacterized DUF497 family protein
LAGHKVRPEEAEQTLSGLVVDLDYRVTEDGEERWTGMGQSTDGRILVIVWTQLDDGSYRPITAYQALSPSTTASSKEQEPERFEGTKQ